MGSLAQTALYIFAAFGFLSLAISIVDRLAQLRDPGYPPLSVLIVFRDKEAVVEGMIRSITSFGALGGTHDYEIVAVDDNSLDSTGDILDRIARNSDTVRVLRLRESGPGANALETGLFFAKSPVSLLCDARGAFDVSSALESIFNLLGPHTYRRSGITTPPHGAGGHEPQRASR